MAMVHVWSNIPTEIGLQIAYHNADDLQTLLAMSLASRAMRNVSIEPLFSTLHFSCREDFARWLAMLHHRPSLGSAVRRVKLSLPLQDAPSSDIPSMINVVEVEWSSNQPWDSKIAGLYMTQLFPKATRLSLMHQQFRHLAEISYLVRSCALPLRRLTIRNTSVSEDANARPPNELGVVPVDLSALAELTLHSNAANFDSNGQNSLGRLLSINPPQLHTLKLYATNMFQPCAMMTMILLLRTSASTLTHLDIDPNRHPRQNPLFNVAIMAIPQLSALLELTIHLTPLNTVPSSDIISSRGQSESFFLSLGPMPSLATLHFVIRIPSGQRPPEMDYNALNDVFSFRPLALREETLKARFRALEHVEWVFCVHASVLRGNGSVERQRVKLKMGYKTNMETRLRARLLQLSTPEEVVGRGSIAWRDSENRAILWEE
uniref:F-box domain-containing protein n=1 Tax=Mycena chlorophos TaxID=658473 RepID=A0ABQ0LCV8_MYCCL|nr:predicted protein [Mycena chlorophos]